MSLKFQLQSLVFSFAFGLFISLLFNIIYKYMFLKNIYLRIILSILYVFGSASLYFFFLNIINNGILNNYFIYFTFAGFIVGNSKTKKIRYYLIRKQLQKIK